MYDKHGKPSQGRSGNLAAVVSVRFEPEEVELLRQVAPEGKVSRFIRQAAMGEVRRMTGATGDGSGRSDPGASTVVGPAVTSAPSTGAFSIVGSARDAAIGSPAPWDVGPDAGDGGPASPTTDG